VYVSSFDVQRSGMVCDNSIMLIVGVIKVGDLKQKSCGREAIGVVVVWLCSNGMKVI